MLTPGTSGSQTPMSRVQAQTAAPSRPSTLGSTSVAPPSDSATAGTQDAIEIDDDVAVGSKRKTKLKSKVWEEFDRLEINGVWKAKCNWCKKLLGGNTKHGTNHLRGHLEICLDRSVRKGLKQSSLKVTTNPQDGTVTLEKYIFDQDVARKKLALMIIVHEYPLSMVDHVGFRKFCAALQPLFKVVSRNTIRKDILDMYEVQKQSMLKYFRKLNSRVAVTTDLWIANHQKKGYMAVTTHFLDDDWKLIFFLLRFICVPAPHTAEVITDVLHEILLDWHIERNLSTITLDNCSTNDNLMRNMIGTSNDNLKQSMDAMQGLKYPTPRKIARDVLPIPMSTVASESVFSTGGRIISPHRSRLAPSMVEALMCIKAWSRAYMLGSHSTFVGALMTCLDDDEEEMDEPNSTVVD